MNLVHLYRTPALSDAEARALREEARAHVSETIEALATETCFNVLTEAALTEEEERVLRWLLNETFAPDRFAGHSLLAGDGTLLEVGPRMSFTTAWSTNAVSICHACGLDKISRIERSRRYLIRSVTPLDADRCAAFLNRLHDRMTECPYAAPLTTFDPGVAPKPSHEVPLMQRGRAALEQLNAEMGLAFDDWDLDYYTNLFVETMGRNPTNVECFDIAQSNSEHSRHWFFKGRIVIDRREMPASLIGMIRGPLEQNPENSVIAFKDNSSAVSGFEISTLLPAHPDRPGAFESSRLRYHILFTAETHNFPCAVAPFPGAETGTGGRIRDVHAAGRGGLVVAATAAYCVGNLRVPGYVLPWEDSEFLYPPNLAAPLQIEIEASNGASDYGNKFGEPVIQGFTRSFGLRMPNGERREWLKPIMFSGGIGQIDARHVEKGAPEAGMLVVKLGGPAYRIGMGGGSASSMAQGENVAELDFNAVQRGDAEMEQKVNRVIRACIELQDRNPIISIHDQGAGGNCNVLKELVDPEGARIELRAIPVGDKTLSAIEIWGAEYQEQNALLIRPEASERFGRICEREGAPYAVVGRVTGDGKVVLHDDRDGSTPVDLELEKVLGDMPRKTFRLERAKPRLRPLRLPEGLTVRAALDRVLRLVSVGSKRFLTNKVDRSVTGLIAQQPCTGPLQLTVADVAVIAQGHFGKTGAATAIGQQPVIGLIDPVAMARMSVAEALTNLVWAEVTALEDVKCSANWMWAAKFPGEGAALYDAAKALCDTLLKLGVAIDGGKDSLSMAALAPDGAGGDESVKAPGALVVSAYVTCPDITKTVTPDLKRPGQGRLLYVDLGLGNHRLGGSALAQVFGQVGDECPDLADPQLLKDAFVCVQRLVSEGLITSGHDRSDGGLATTLIEMAISGNCGIEVDLEPSVDPLALCFAEEPGLVLEVSPAHEPAVSQTFARANVPCLPIGISSTDARVRMRQNGETILDESVADLRDLWEATSTQLERLQAHPGCVAQERERLRNGSGLRFDLSFTPEASPPEVLDRNPKPRVAILREEGSNGDREMASAFYAAGFEPWDVTMSDLVAGTVTLDRFRGVAFVGGFSYADVLDSAKGWAGTIRFNAGLSTQFDAFYDRPDTFSLGVCNGCQLMALLGWIPWKNIADADQPRFVQNASGRFESRFVSVKIEKSPAIMLREMEASTLGIWAAHGEGRAFFPDTAILDRVAAENTAPIRYVDDEGSTTEAYPCNPNGSPAGIAALCSPDGRHLAMMPHPERTFLKWQWAWMPEGWKRDLEASPWLKMFQNAREWCSAFAPTRAQADMAGPRSVSA